MLHFVSLLACYFGKTLGTVGVDDGAGGVDDEAAVVVPTILTHFFQRTALGTDAGNEEEVIWGEATDLSEG